jgi:hypothetical protein
VGDQHVKDTAHDAEHPEHHNRKSRSAPTVLSGNAIQINALEHDRHHEGDELKAIQTSESPLRHAAKDAALLSHQDYRR